VHATRAGTGWEPLFRLVFERSSNPLALVDEHRRFVDINEAWLELVARSREEVVGHSTVDEIQPSERPRAASEWQRFLQSGEYSGSRSLLRGDGSEVDIEFAARLASVENRRLAIYVALADAGLNHGPIAERPRARALTNREREVVTFIALGRDTGQIAKELFISVETVRTHVRNAMAKLGAHTRAQLVAIVLGSEDAIHKDCLDD
jgi:PAS domain S-box-containing protein